MHTCEEPGPACVFLVAGHKKFARFVIEGRLRERDDEKAADDLRLCVRAF